MRPFGISRDSPWSHRAWAEALGVEVPLLSDWEGEAASGFGVGTVVRGMAVAARSAFLVDRDTVVAAWMLGAELPDVDAAIAAASSRSP